MSAESVFAAAVALTRLPGLSGSGSSNPGAGAASGGGSGGGGGGGGGEGDRSAGSNLTATIPFSMSGAPSAPSISNSPAQAAYAGSSATLAWATPPAAGSPAYGSPTAPPTTPSVSISAPPACPTIPGAGEAGSANLSMASKPGITIGARPGLINPEIAAFQAVPIALYAGALPNYEPIAETYLADPERLDYSADADLIERLKVTLAGNDVLNAAIQQAIFDVQTQALARQELMGTQGAMRESAARGFSMPSGAVNAKVAELTREVREAKEKAAFAVRDEAYERGRNLLLAATSKAIALEAKRFEIHLRYGKHLVQTLAFNAKAMKELFDATVQLFNAKAELVNAAVGNYKEYVRAVEAQDAAKVAEVRASLESALKYSAEVKMYEAQVATAKAIADVEATDARQQALVLAEYEAYLIGAMSNVDTVRANVEGFREAVRAFGKAVEAEGEKFDVQAESIRAAGSMVGVWEANASAYAGFWRAEEARTGTYSNYVQDSARVFDAQVDEFRQYAQAHRSWVQAQTAKVQAEANAMGAYSRAARAGSSYVSAYNRAEAERAGAANMESMSRAAASMNSQSLRAADDAFKARQRANQIASEAIISGGLAQAALGVISASVSIRGTVDVGRSATQRGSTEFSHTGSRTWSETRSHGDGGGE